MYETPEMEEIKLKMEGALLGEGASTQQGGCPVNEPSSCSCEDDF